MITPHDKYRGIPFWAWNGKLEEQELREQIRSMKKMGLGGFFMHSRIGLDTPYLSEEWFRMIEVCIDEARRQKMRAWLYDEDRWPSGAAGGLVTKDEKYRIRFLEFNTVQSIPKPVGKGLQAAFIIELDSGLLVSYRPYQASDKLRENEQILLFQEKTGSPQSWFNDQTYLDTLNPEAVEQFVQVTHEEYRKRFSSTFGNLVPGIFTDEPNFISHVPGNTLPWTGKLPAAFRKKYGYAIEEHLPELVYPIYNQDFSKARLDYRNMLTELFCNAFGKIIGDWCEKNNLLYTGHVLCEDTLANQTYAVGTAMRFYEFMQVPGIDLLTERWFIFNTAKQCTSVARQFGRKWRLTETYGCTGWDFPFMGHKAMGDWQVALGINLRCQHLAWYTMAADAKRDYPASISYQSPWADEYSYVEDYFARIATALEKGEEVRDLLVIHPIESFWGRHVPGNTLPENFSFIQLTNELLGQHLDFDFGDEELMSRYATVRKKRIFINKASYRAVLIPEVRTIRASTLELLHQFANNGGKVFYMGRVPQYLDGEESLIPKEKYADFRHISNLEFDLLLSPHVRHVRIQNHDGLEITPALYLLKKGSDFQTLFLCNTSCYFQTEQMKMPMVRDRQLAYPKAKVIWDLPRNYHLYQMDTHTGKLHSVPQVTATDKGISFPCPLEPLASRLFIASRKPLDAKAPLPRPVQQLKNASVLPDQSWPVSLDEPNALLLDMPQAKINNGAWQEATHCLRLDSDLRAMLGLRPRGGSMVQPWCRGKSKNPKQLDLTLKYEFACKVLPKQDCQLALECPEQYEITLNNSPISTKDTGYWCDRSIRTLHIDRRLFKTGTNQLLLKSKFDENTAGLENIFLLGDFGVKDYAIVSPVKSLKFGDWTKQGLPFYTGNLIYDIALPEGVSKVEIPEWRGVALAYALDDQEEFTLLPWPPFIIPVQRARRLRVKVLNSRRNAFGPFFLRDKWPPWTGPGQFKTYETKEHGLVPCGLLAPLRYNL